MAINKNHEFEELDGVKCGVVEKNASAERVAFLKRLLEHNRYQVVVVPSTPAKAVAAKQVTTDPGAEVLSVQVEPALPGLETFTIGVTDYTFNSINAIFGRVLRSEDGHVVTQAYWQQRDTSSNDEIPYYENVILKK